MQNRDDNQRLFFALYPDATARARLHATALRELPAGTGQFVVADDLHITLVFLGHVGRAQRPCISQLAAGIRCDPVSLSMDRIGHWRAPRVAWAGCSQEPDAMRRLVAQLGAGVSACGIAVDPRPFAIHMTLVRKAGKHFPLRALAPPVELYFDRFCLMSSQSKPGSVRYQVAESWPLRAAEPV